MIGIQGRAGFNLSAALAARRQGGAGVRVVLVIVRPVRAGIAGRRHEVGLWLQSADLERSSIGREDTNETRLLILTGEEIAWDLP